MADAKAAGLMAESELLPFLSHLEGRLREKCQRPGHEVPHRVSVLHQTAAGWLVEIALDGLVGEKSVIYTVTKLQAQQRPEQWDEDFDAVWANDWEPKPL